MARVLVIEDDADLRGSLHYNLSQAGHHPFAGGTGEAGLKLAFEVRPDIRPGPRRRYEVATLLADALARRRARRP